MAVYRVVQNKLDTIPLMINKNNRTVQNYFHIIHKAQTIGVMVKIIAFKKMKVNKGMTAM